MIREMPFLRAGLLALAASALFAAEARPQYFGRNKVQYESFDFRILESPHFRLHFYPEEEQPARDMTRMAERWNTRLSAPRQRSSLGGKCVPMSPSASAPSSASQSA